MNGVGSDVSAGGDAPAVAVAAGAPVVAAGSSPRATVASRGPVAWKAAAASDVCLPAVSAMLAWKIVLPLSIATT